jgi:hypothetical protein
MPGRLEFVSQGLEVVDFTIQDNPFRTVFVCHGLPSLLAPVDDAETTHPNARAGGSEVLDSDIIRAAMQHRVAHAPNEFDPSSR